MNHQVKARHPRVWKRKSYSCWLGVTNTLFIYLIFPLPEGPSLKYQTLRPFIHFRRKTVTRATLVKQNATFFLDWDNKVVEQKKQPQKAVLAENCSNLVTASSGNLPRTYVPMKQTCFRVVGDHLQESAKPEPWHTCTFTAHEYFEFTAKKHYLINSKFTSIFLFMHRVLCKFSSLC